MFNKTKSTNGWFTIREASGLNKYTRYYLNIGTKKNCFGNEIFLCDSKDELIKFINNTIDSLFLYKMELEKK